MPLRTDGFERLLSALSGDSQQYFGDPNAILEPVARLERPFSALLRLRVLASGRESHAFLKVFRPSFEMPKLTPSYASIKSQVAGPRRPVSDWQWRSATSSK